MNYKTACRSRIFLITAAIFAITALAGTVHADDGQPVAIRFWSGNGVTIETMWNLHVGLRINEGNRGDIRRAPELEVVDTAQQWKGDGLQTQLLVWDVEKETSFVLDRLPDTANASWNPASKSTNPTSNAVVISKVELQTTASKELVLINKIVVDGVIIIDVADSADVLLKAIEENPESIKTIQNANCLLLSGSNPDAGAFAKLAKLITPSAVLFPASAALDKIGDSEVTKVSHNTFAVSKPKAKPTETKWFSLTDKTWEMPEVVADLFEKKEAACQESRKLFASLSVEQMNFKPDNGSHTPRWNAEHMMGRELGFFSQIYRAVDPSIREMDLNPKQMPKDYKFKHPEWSGMEEAQQMSRVTEFTRRFAYLLEGMELDKRAKGSRFWTPRSLLKQMERHYNEHTANVRKKMKLSEWPAK